MFRRMSLRSQFIVPLMHVDDFLNQNIFVEYKQNGDEQNTNVNKEVSVSVFVFIFVEISVFRLSC